MTPGHDALLRLPKRLQLELILLVTGKLAMLGVLYWAFFSPAHRPALDVARHIAGGGP